MQVSREYISSYRDLTLYAWPVHIQAGQARLAGITQLHDRRAV